MATFERLHASICEHLPPTSLPRVPADLVQVGKQQPKNEQQVHRPKWVLHAISALPLTLDLLQPVKPGLSTIFLLAASAPLLISLELSRERSRCQQALHELRAVAHVVDMHQLTKDPEHALRPGGDTRPSPRRQMTPFELTPTSTTAMRGSR